MGMGHDVVGGKVCVLLMLLRLLSCTRVRTTRLCRFGGGRGNGSGSGGGSGGGSGNGNEDGNGWGSINLYILFPIPGKYYYLLENQTIIQKVKIRYDLHNASTQEEIDLLVEWYETVQEIDKAK